MNLATAIVLLVLLTAVLAIVKRMLKNKKDGKGGCSCGCGSCPNSQFCHNKSDS